MTFEEALKILRAGGCVRRTMGVILHKEDVYLKEVNGVHFRLQGSDIFAEDWQEVIPEDWKTKASKLCSVFHKDTIHWASMSDDTQKAWIRVVKAL